MATNLISSDRSCLFSFYLEIDLLQIELLSQLNWSLMTQNIHVTNEDGFLRTTLSLSHLIFLSFVICSCSSAVSVCV